MNCANHPEIVAAAYCQNCGKPLCTSCVRSVNGVIYCEPCLAARLSPGMVSAQAGAPYSGMHAHPLLAGLLGFIPGVGAMYNGQFVKAIAHVLIFAVFVSLSDKTAIFGLLVAAWVFYQVFDAAQTAKARRDGMPLPNPFGLNDLGVRLGIAPAPFGTGFTPPPPTASPNPASAAGGGFAPPPAQDAGPAQGWDPVPPPAGGFSDTPGAAGYSAPQNAAPGYASQSYPPQSYPGPGYAPVPPAPLPVPERSRTPVGAVVLIGVGVVLLLNTLGIFEDEWIGRSWPLILIAIGVWLLYHRSRNSNSRGGF